MVTAIANELDPRELAILKPIRRHSWMSEKDAKIYLA
jgi:hypothetical protein